MDDSSQQVGVGFYTLILAVALVGAPALATAFAARSSNPEPFDVAAPWPIPVQADAPEEWTGFIIHVPDDYATIQSAVDAAEPGDLILIQPGVYNEAVSVSVPGLVLRGTDRNKVILDGEFTRENGVSVTADGVAIENITARNYTVSGFSWTGVIGYRGSYLTAVDDWVNGIHAFDSVDGVFEYSYASGSSGAGLSIGQCDPCHAVITDVVAEFNGLGYSGTNSSGNIWIVNSEWRYNVAGIAPNTLDSDLMPPVSNVVIAGNYIHHNGEEERAPSRTAEWSAYGNGVVLAGARDSVVRNNLMVNNRTSGVQVVSMIDANLWRSGDNEVRDNVIRGSGRADLLLGGPLEQSSCFSGNRASSTVPYFLQLLHDCDGYNLPLWYGLATSSEPLGRMAQAAKGQNPQLEHGDAPKPRLNFEQLPVEVDAPARPAVDVFDSLDFNPDSIATPLMPDDIEIDDRRPTVFGIVLGAGFWPVLYGALMWWVPVAIWIFGGLWALSRLWLGYISKTYTFWVAVAWSGAVIFWPILGVLVFTVFGFRERPVAFRLITVLGGGLAWIVITAVALFVGDVL